MDKAVGERAGQAIGEKVFPGCVIGIVRASSERQIQAFGRYTYDADSPEVTGGTVYDVASVTKSIPLASLAALSIEKGEFALADPVKRYVPELRNDHGATIEDLLRYRVCGTRLSTLRHKTFEEIRTHVLERGFDAPPGESVYTNLPAYVLGLIIERVGGKSLPALAQEYLFGPLGMERTIFFPSPDDCAPTEVDERGKVKGLPHDESAYVFAKARRAAGHAGLFSTVPDLLNFLEALFAGELPAVFEGAQQGLGWQTEGEFLGSRPEGRFGKTGFTGCSVACDTERGIGLVMLSNRTYPKRPPDQYAINRFRRDIADIVFDRTRLH